MIISASIYVAGVIIMFITGIFSLINIVLPEQFTQAILYFTQGIHLLKGIFPVQTLLQAFSYILAFWTVWYTFKLAIWIIKFIPGFHHVTHPHETMQRETETIGRNSYGTWRSKQISKYRKGK